MTCPLLHGGRQHRDFSHRGEEPTDHGTLLPSLPLVLHRLETREKSTHIHTLGGSCGYNERKAGLMDTSSGIVPLLRALHFAANKHRDQRRKGVEASPYINHLIEVAELLAREG